MKWAIVFFDKRGEVYNKAFVLHETLEQSEDDIKECMRDIYADYEGVEEDESIISD